MSTTEQSAPHAARRQSSPSKAEVSEARALAKEVGLDYVDLDRYPLNAAATSLLPQQAARRHHSLAVGWKYGTPVVAVSRPDDIMVMDDLRTTIGREIHAVVACESQIDAYIERMYGRAEPPAATPHAATPRSAPDSAAKSPPASPSARAESPVRPAPAEPPSPPSPDTVPSTRAEKSEPGPAPDTEPALDLEVDASSASASPDTGTTAEEDTEARRALA
ncbi:MAG: hypothetical protein ABR972_03685, partial [Acidimicrobiales bacterium]